MPSDCPVWSCYVLSRGHHSVSGCCCSRCFSGIPVWLHSHCRLSRRSPCCSGRDSLPLACRGCYGLRAVLDASALGPCSPLLLNLPSSSLLSSCLQSVHSVACSAGRAAGLSPFCFSLFLLGPAWPDCPTASLCSFSPRVLGWTVPSVRSLLTAVRSSGSRLFCACWGAPVHVIFSSITFVISWGALRCCRTRHFLYCAARISHSSRGRPCPALCRALSFPFSDRTVGQPHGVIFWCLSLLHAQQSVFLSSIEFNQNIIVGEVH